MGWRVMAAISSAEAAKILMSLGGFDELLV